MKKYIIIGSIFLACLISFIAILVINNNDNNSKNVLNTTTSTVSLEYKLMSDDMYHGDLLTSYQEYLNYKPVIGEVTYDDAVNTFTLTKADFEESNFIVLSFSYADNEKFSVSTFMLSDDSATIYLADELGCGVLPAKVHNIFIGVSKETTNINDFNVSYKYINDVTCDSNVDYKPMIYIYPKEEMDLTVKLLNSDNLTYTYPKYNSEWNIHVDESGNIYDYDTKEKLLWFILGSL